ncbi:MAG: hypothetical protein ABII01_04790 [Candidatus Woesearchaeota archaeon]
MDKSTIVLVTIEILLACLALFMFVKDDITGYVVCEACVELNDCDQICEEHCVDQKDYVGIFTEGKVYCRCNC